jgi:hypothetical protein
LRAPDQCRNDPDGAVDVDERLTLKDVVPGRYDVKLADKKGPICVVRNVEVLPGKPYAFSISHYRAAPAGQNFDHHQDGRVVDREAGGFRQLPGELPS